MPLFLIHTCSVVRNRRHELKSTMEALMKSITVIRLVVLKN